MVTTSLFGTVVTSMFCLSLRIVILLTWQADPVTFKNEFQGDYVSEIQTLIGSFQYFVWLWNSDGLEFIQVWRYLNFRSFLTLKKKALAFPIPRLTPSMSILFIVEHLSQGLCLPLWLETSWGSWECRGPHLICVWEAGASRRRGRDAYFSVSVATWDLYTFA